MANEKPTQTEVSQLASRMLCEIISDNTPHSWVRTEEPFYNFYSDRINYDYSGEVRKLDKQSYDMLLGQLGSSEASFLYSSDLEELLNEIYINSWTPSYVSNCGKNWTSYMDLLRQRLSFFVRTAIL